MRLLVTGGLGFIGSNFVRQRLAASPDFAITNLDKGTYAGNPENLRDVEDDKRYRFVKGDIADEKAVEAAVADCDWIVNFAAESHVDRSIEDPRSFLQTDVVGTHVLLEAARRDDLPFCQISTDEVYGSIETGSFSEEDRLDPSSPYSASKSAADLLVNAYVRTYGLQAVVTRSTNNFGPYQYPEKLIPVLVTNALLDQPLPIYGDGKNVRDWLFVEDNCEAIALVLEKGKPGTVYNIGAGEERQNIEIARLVLSILGKPESLIRFVQDRPGHDRRYSVDAGRVRALGWKPRHDFEEALSKTVAWYRENEAWWRSLRPGGER